MRTWTAVICSVWFLGEVSFSALAQPDPPGLDFVTITSPGNPAYRGPDPDGLVFGRGRVDYQYRIGRTEVPTSLWLDYFNTFSARPDFLSDSVLGETPLFWGAQRDPTYSGPGRRYRLIADPNAAEIPGFSVTWRTAAKLCNWLHNGRSSDPAAIMNGAYDVSTFANPTSSTFSDQPAHHPDARYWIPTFDEWLKAAHWDPTHVENDGWWRFSTTSDQPPVYGPPGQGEANAGFSLPNLGHYRIPLGAYPEVTSPWGLLDVAGGTIEWNESIFRVGQAMFRGFDGSSPSNDLLSAPLFDDIAGTGYERPDVVGWRSGLRIASSIPAPAGVAILFPAMLLYMSRRPGRGTGHATTAGTFERSGRESGSL